MFENVKQWTEWANKTLDDVQQLRDALVDMNVVADQDAFLDQYNTLETNLTTVAAQASLLGSVHPDAGMQDAAESIEREVSEFATKLGLDTELFAQFQQVDISALDADAGRMVEHTLRDFRRAGVDKAAETRAKIEQLEKELVEIGQTFDRNIRQDVRHIELDSADDLAGLPEDFIASHQPDEKGKIRITTDYPDYFPFMRFSPNERLRAELGTASRQRGYPDNVLVLKEMIKKRYELARLLGYESWAEFVTADKMIQTPGMVSNFIDRLTQIATPVAEKEYAALLAQKQQDSPDADELFFYDINYYGEQYRRATYDFGAQEVRAYFSYAKVRDGLLRLVEELFDVAFVAVENPNVWHESVDVYDVVRGDVSVGRIYLDMHPRTNKYKHAAQFDIVPGVRDVQLPEAALVCNFPEPDDAQPGLMDHGQVTTFFHEFGHLMHTILGGDQRWVQFSGVATEWDFVEAPSQLFEEWAWDYDVLTRFATHHDTGETIPKQLVEKMQAADKFGNGIFVQQQLFYTSLSYNYYHRDPESFDPHELMVELQAMYSMFPYVDETYFQLSFGHLHGYSAMYYTYLWSLVIAKDIVSAFHAQGFLDKNTALRYRDCILAPGGSKDAADLVKDFLGRDYTFDAFEAWLSGK